MGEHGEPGHQNFPMIDGFEIVGELGTGGMGTVYRAVEIELDRQVAIKLVDRPLARDANFRERFEAEIHMAASLQHPNIVPVYAIGETGSDLFMSMMLVPGSDLEKIVERDGPMPPAMAIAITKQIASALDEAHRQRLIHRDVKPQNVIVDERTSHAYLTDFGIARSLDATTGLTTTGHVIGSINYMSPEQFDGKPVDHRTDIYSLACLLYALISGDRPFNCESVGATIRQKLVGPSTPSLAERGFSPELSHTIETAQAVDPDRRYWTAGEFAEAAARAVQAPGSATTAAYVVPGRTQPMHRHASDPRQQQTSRIPDQDRGRPRPWRWVLLGSLIALVIGGGAAAALLASSGGSDGSGQESAGKPAGGTEATNPSDQNADSGLGGGGGDGVNRPTNAARFVPFTGNLYTADVPKGWNLETSEEKNSGRFTSQWRDPNDSNTSVLIDSQPSANGTALEGAESVRAQTSQTSGYEEIAFSTTKLKGVEAVRWVFDVSEDRRVDYFLVECGAGFAVLGSTSPERFDEMEPTFHHVAESLAPIYCE